MPPWPLPDRWLFAAALLGSALLRPVAGAEGPLRTLASAAAALRSADARERASAAAYLGARRTPAERGAAVVALIPALDDPDPSVRRGVVNALTDLEEPIVARCFASRLGREADPEVVASLLVGLGALGGADDVARVLPYARDPRPALRAAAITALGDLGGEAARATALRALDETQEADPEWSLRSAALLALARCGRPEDVGRALVTVREGDGWRHWFARSAVARLVAAHDPEPLPTLRRLAEDGDARVAVTAAEGLGRRGAPDEVARLLEHARPEVRAAGTAAVARIPLRALVPRLRTLARLDPSRSVRWTAARALFRLSDPLGDELVLEAVGAREPSVWAEAVALLAERTGAEHGRDVAAWRGALVSRGRGP